MDKQPAQIEVKFAVANATGKAMEKLGPIPADAREYTVHFFDQEAVTLLGAGLILRVRQGIGFTGGGDSTCKLRGPLAPGAAEKFGIDGDNGRKFEGDQNVGGEERPSYSITLEPPPVAIPGVLTGKPPLQEMFGPEADEFLHATGATWESLWAYGPIQARKWKTQIAELGGKVTIEWWKVGSLSLLEISDKKDRGKAPGFIEALRIYMIGTMGVAQLAGSKTEFALRHIQPFALATG